MRMRTSLPSTLVCLTATAAGAVAQGVPQDVELSLDPNRIYVAARFSFNVSADLRNMAVVPNAPPEYDDVFVRPDISGSTGGLTWNWGYESADQLSDTVPGGSLNLHYVAGSPRDLTTQALDSDLTAGFEVGYGRQLGLIHVGPNRNMVWGVQAAFGSLDVNLESTSLITGNAARVTHQYNLSGVVPPLAPYSGSYEGPGPLLPSTFASSATDYLSASSTQHATLDAMVLGFKIGPFLEFPVHKRLSLQAGAGVAVMDVLAELTCRESLQLAGLTAPLLRDYQYEHDEWVFGFYASVGVGWALSDTMTVFAGAQYLGIDDVTVAGAAREATLKLNQSIEIVAGVRVSF